MMLGTLMIAAVFALQLNADIDFDSQVLPVLTKAGCNAGACHGAAAGRGGFHLSLFGSDPNADYKSIVEYAEGRRVNLVDAAKSLVLAKPLGMIEHGGDVVLHDGSAATELLRRWLQKGARRGSGRELVQFRVVPSEAIAIRQGDAVSLRALARFSDGVKTDIEETDVTEWTLFRSEDATSVELLNQPVQARCHRPGKHVIMARFWNRIVPVSILLPYDNTSESTLPASPTSGLIDSAIDSQLVKLNLSPIVGIDDPAFLRRLQLDLTGRLPTPEELLAHASLPFESRREQEIDKLLASEEFSTFWALRLARWLRLRGASEEPQAAQAYSDWILKSLKDRRPYNDLVRELLTATGDSHVVGAANFTRTTADARLHAELVSSVLMGTRMHCANCHNHPFASWTQDDYHGLAAIFAKFDRSRVVSIKKQGAVTNLRTGESAIPRLPGVRFLDETEPALVKFTDWLCEKENPYFAKAIVNRLWDAMMGRGLVSGVDDFRETNPPSHSKLLDDLALDFTSNGYDIRRTLRLIANSNAYARSCGHSSSRNALEPWYGVATPKPLLAEVHLDAIDDILCSSERSPTKNRQRAITRLDPTYVSADLEILGRCSKQDACQAIGQSQGLAPKLHAINGDLINRRIVDKEGRLQSYLRAGMTPQAIIEDLYLRALSKKPNPIQLQSWLVQLHGISGEEQRRWLEDFVWAILSSQDFSMNH